MERESNDAYRQALRAKYGLETDNSAEEGQFAYAFGKKRGSLASSILSNSSSTNTLTSDYEYHSASFKSDNPPGVGLSSSGECAKKWLIYSNLATLILGLAAVIYSVLWFVMPSWFTSTASNDTNWGLDSTIFIAALGGLTVIVTLIATIGTCVHSSFCLHLYNIAMFITIIGEAGLLTLMLVGAVSSVDVGETMWKVLPLGIAGGLQTGQSRFYTRTYTLSYIRI